MIKGKKACIFGIIILLTVGGVMLEGYNKNLKEKADLKADVEQLSHDIKKEESRVSNTTELHNDSDKDTLQIAINSAKEVYENPNHTDLEVYNSSTELSVADDMFTDTILTNHTSTENTYTDTTSSNDEEVWQYCVDRWAYYDTLEGEYSADKHTDDVFNDGATQFGISSSEVKSTWDKVEMVKKGVSK